MTAMDDWLAGTLTLDTPQWGDGAFITEHLLAFGATIETTLQTAAVPQADDDAYRGPAQRLSHAAQNIRMTAQSMIGHYLNLGTTADEEDPQRWAAVGAQSIADAIYLQENLEATIQGLVEAQ
jgi:hypothetical protein